MSKLASQEALTAIQSALDYNPWAVPAEKHPNAEKLLDGAAVRHAVAPADPFKMFVKVNKDKVGFYKRPELNEKASAEAVKWSCAATPQKYRNRVARIYQ